MPLSDNEELERRWKLFGDKTCPCGKPAHNMNYPGFCSSDCHYDVISDEIDKHPIQSPRRPHGSSVTD